MRIDGHCHLGTGMKRQLSVDELLRDMDRYEIDKAVVCPTDEFIAVFNREGNDFILQAVQEHPDRFIGFATVNPWYGVEGIRELRRSLELGLKGLKLNPSTQGMSANDEILFPVMEMAEAYGIPVYCHTGTPVGCLPLQLADLANRFPRVSFIMGHMGSSDFVHEVVPAMSRARNIFAETSKILRFEILREVIMRFGASRVMFGSNCPDSTYQIELEKIRLLDLAPGDLEWVLSGTILSLIT
jgi:predicted TIM-barrel fold metal-dependent hydrolase